MKIKITKKDGTEYKGTLIASRYPNTKRLCLSIESVEEGSIAKFTSNLDGLNIADDEVLIRDCYKNEGFYEQLLDLKIIAKKTITYCLANNVKVHQCKLLINSDNLPTSVFR